MPPTIPFDAWRIAVDLETTRAVQYQRGTDLDEPIQSDATVALVKISDQGWDRSLEELKAAMIKEAAKVGGDAVIVGTETRDAGAAFVPVGSMYYGIESAE